MLYKKGQLLVKIISKCFHTQIILPLSLLMVKYEMYLNITKAIYDEPMVNIFSVMETQTI